MNRARLDRLAARIGDADAIPFLWVDDDHAEAGGLRTTPDEHAERYGAQIEEARARDPRRVFGVDFRPPQIGPAPLPNG